MRDFFHGWRRKTGCVLLVMACGFAGIWAWSDRLVDTIGFHLGGTQYEIISVHSDIWYSWQSSDISSFYWHRFSRQNCDLRTMFRQTIIQNEDTWIIPDWAPVLSLSLFSVYLLLWRSIKPPTTIQEPEIIKQKFVDNWYPLAGRLMLTMACLLLVIWVRSGWRYDVFSFAVLGWHHVVESSEGTCKWSTEAARPNEPVWQYYNYSTYVQPFTGPFYFRPSVTRKVPYEWAILPLLLVSVLLLHRKPRKPTMPSQPEAPHA